VKKVIAQLYDALKHAETRLNQIPHRYQETDFRKISEVLRVAEKILKIEGVSHGK